MTGRWLNGSSCVRRQGAGSRGLWQPPAIFLALLIVSLGGWAHAGDADWPAIEAAAKKVGKLTLYHNLPPPGDEGLIAAFESAHAGMKVETVRLGSSALIQRFEAETTAGVCPADALMIIYDEAENRWIDNGWVLEWTPPEAAAYPAEFRHRDRLFTTQLFREAIIYNTTRIKHADAPKSYADLFDPKWKGKVGLNPPWRSVAVQGVVAFWEKHLGITSVAQRLKDNDVRFFSGSAGVMQAVVRGDVWIGSLIDPAVINALADGAPIAAVYPETGVPAAPAIVLVPAKALSVAAGKVFANWLPSEQGQTALQSSAGSPAARPGLTPPKFVPPNSALKITLTPSLLTPDYQQAMLKEFRTIFNVQ
jgi:iron(III) transport system substrate-binding protein